MADWVPPAIKQKFYEQAWRRVEAKGWKGEDVSHIRPIEFFHHPLVKKVQSLTEYDRYFGYTRIRPLWNPKKKKDNTQYLPDVFENIFQQEKNKAVPVKVSLDYGRPCRPFYDEPSIYKRTQSIKDFTRRQGVMKVIEKHPAK